jgi:hypothetical protein
MMVRKIRIVDIQIDDQPVRLRLPFRYGVTTLHHAQQALVTVRIRSNGQEAIGRAAELLAPKWFDKSPELSDEDNVAQLKRALDMVRRRYLDTTEALTAFDLHGLHDAAHMQEAARCGLNGLVAGFGTAVIDKAVVAALCRLEGVSFFDLIRGNGVGLTAATAPDLEGMDLSLFLRDLKPSRTIVARHTVGAIDALSDAEIVPEARRNDGLPESLDAAIRYYGLKAFKIKLTGQPAFDLARLRAIAEVLDAAAGPYMATLDGNEQFADAKEFASFWNDVSSDRSIHKLVDAIRFVEQPIARAMALDRPLGALAERVAFEIDESDEDIAAFPRAVSLGYKGVSSKSCKGIYRSLLNRARVARLNGGKDMGSADGYFMSAEDLSAQAGLAVQQDLALATLIGCRTTERNGHHFGDGRLFSSDHDYASYQASCPGLYQSQADRLCLRIESGAIDLGALFRVGAFG